jgi:hypothetical protein
MKKLVIALLISVTTVSAMSVVSAEAQVETCVWPNPCLK